MDIVDYIIFHTIDLIWFFIFFYNTYKFIIYIYYFIY